MMNIEKLIIKMEINFTENETEYLFLTERELTLSDEELLYYLQGAVAAVKTVLSQARDIRNIIN